MKPKLLFFFLLSTLVLNAQNTFDWNADYKLQQSDFQSTATQIGSNLTSLDASPQIKFEYQMSMAQFMFTKNFNAKVSYTFTRNAAAFTAPDEATAEKIINFAQYEFDLTELYARKLRKKLFEAKGTFSDTNFFKSAYDEIQKEYTERHVNAGTTTNLGQNEAQLKTLHDEVLQEIMMYSDFCKSCKPPKKTKPKK